MKSREGSISCNSLRIYKSLRTLKIGDFRKSIKMVVEIKAGQRRVNVLVAELALDSKICSLEAGKEDLGGGDLRIWE